MANNQCIIDDAFCTSMGKYIKTQGIRLDKMIADYVTTLKVVQNTAIQSGEVYNVLDEYITYAESVKEKFGIISNIIQNDLKDFQDDVDEADQYLF